MKLTYGNAPDGEALMLSRLNTIFNRADTLRDEESSPLIELPELGFNGVLLAPDPDKLPDEKSMHVVMRPIRLNTPRIGYTGDFVFYISYLLAKLEPEYSGKPKQGYAEFSISDFETAVAETGETYHCRKPLLGGEVELLYEELGKYMLVTDPIRD